MDGPIKIVGTKVFAKLDYSISLKSLSELPRRHILWENNVYWRNDNGKHLKLKGTPKGRGALLIAELRFEFRSFCCNLDDFDPERNDIVEMKGGMRDFVYEWHFVHRHGFSSDVYGSGRGQNVKANDILNHPLSYMLMCNKHHEEYDRENGEWRNPKNHENKKIEKI